MNWSFPHPSQRMPVLADNVVATSQPLAAQAGIAMQQQGGNAVDAAVAAAAALVVVEPVMNGLGSDTQVILWDGAQARGLNSSGRAPAAWTTGRFAGRTKMPAEGWDSVTVPGAVAAWVELAERHGKLPLATLLQPAIRYAYEGFIVSPIVARLWAAQTPRLREQPGFAAAFLPDGRPPVAGERFRFPQLGDALARIAETRGADFYSGDTAERIAAHAWANGGAMTVADLAAHRAEWVDTLKLDYRSITIHQLPPNAQGMAVQIALGILEHFDMGPDAAPDQRIHLQVEAMKVAFADVYAHVADAGAMRMDAASMIDRDYLAQRARSLSLHHAS